MKLYQFFLYFFQKYPKIIISIWFWGILVEKRIENSEEFTTIIHIGQK